MPDAPDPDYDPNSATIPLSGPRPTLSGSNVDLPLPEELAKLLPAGAYEVTGFLGAGGMGAVYKGMQIRLKRPVAIKIMRRDMGKDHDFEARFEREAQAMAKLNHPNIISVIDFGEAGPDYLFIVMELVDGTDLMDVIRSKQMTQEMALALLPQICDALQFAHDHGIVHRDIKPSNIMLTRDGRVKMADFGLAKHFDVAESGFRTQTGTGMGTPDYAAPEQFDPTTPVDHRADIYALGVMIYQMITGALPRGVWRPPSQRAQVSTHWDAVVSRAMQNDPAERYQKASEVKTDVSGITPHQGRAVGPSAAATGPTSVKSPDTALGGPSALPKPKSRALLLAVVAAVVGGWGVFMAVSKKNTAHTIAVTPSSTEPAAIKLWNAPEMIRSLQKSNIRWENDAIHLVDKAGLPDGTVKQANVIVRAEVLMNATSTSPQIAGRVLRNETGPTDHYSLTLKPGLTAVKLTVQHGSLMTELGAWPLPRSYRQDEWLPLELRIVGDEITASAEGRVLGTVKDSSIQGAGGVMLYATEDGWFRNIEYVPLDEPTATAAVSASPPVVEPWVRVWNSPEGLSNAVTLVDGWVVSKTGGTTLGGTLLYPMQWHDSAIRSEWKWSGGPSSGSIGGHMSIREAGKHRYKLSRNKQALLLYRTDDDNVTVLLQEHPVDEPKEGETFTLELRAMGTTLTAKLDGKEVIRVEDDKLTTGGPAVYVFEKGGMRNIEVLNLDKSAVSAVASSSSLPIATSPTKFPPGQWVKLFTKPADLPADLRKPDSGVKWENGWIRGGPPERKLILPASLKANYGLRATFKRSTGSFARLCLRHDFKGLQPYYQIGLSSSEKLTMQATLGGNQRQGVWTIDIPKIADGTDYQLEFAAVGNLSVARFGGIIKTMNIKDAPQGGAQITGLEDVRDIEVMNLDGLPEAAALRLLGVDEKGNDLHGKTGAPSASTTPTPVWRDALAEALLKKVIATANHTDKGYLLPPGNHWEFPAQPVRAGAIRVLAVTEAGSPNHLSLNFGLPGTRDHYQVFFRRKLNECGLAYLKEGLPERRLALKKGVHLADGQPFEFLLARIADEFYFLLNGQVILQAAEPDPTARYLTLNCFGDTHARVQKVEYLNLDGVSEEESLKLAGIFAASASPSLSVSSAPASANKAAPFTNTLGMKFVPVPITGGPTDKQRVLFSVWETRVQDYEAFAKETKREWPKTSFEQGPTHPAVNVSRNDVMAFCIWLTETEKKAGKLDASLVYRLPSDHEWSCAVGIGDKEDPAVSPKDKATKFDGIYPWGVAWPPPVGSGNFSGEEIREHPVSPKQKWIAGYRDDFPATSPTGSFAANSLGLFDLSGNAWERTNDWLDASHAHQVLRGGSFYYSGRTVFSISNRFPGGVEESGYDCGFRIVLAAVAAPTTGRADSPKPPSDGSHAPASKPGALGQSALPSAATKDTPFVNTLGMKFVPVPIPALNASRSDAGGGPTGGQRVLFSVWETRVQDYEAFLKETKREWGKVPFEQGPTHPVVGPNWDDAQAFCDWLTETERKTGKLGANERYRLPSDHEWSCAVDLGDKEDTSKLPAEKHLKIADVFPWGTQWPPPKGAGNFAGEEMQPTLASGKFSNIKGEMPGYHDGFVNTSPVGSFAANRFGLYDMGGNVWQWCADWADGSQKARVLRGSSSQDRDRMFLQSSFRNRYQPQAHMINHGFRCVLEVP